MEGFEDLNFEDLANVANQNRLAPNEGRDRFFNEELPQMLEEMQSCYNKGHVDCVQNQAGHMGMTLMAAVLALELDAGETALGN